MSKKLSKSIKKYIRREKARIKREHFNFEERKKFIDELYNRILSPSKPEKKRTIKKKSEDKKIKEKLAGTKQKKDNKSIKRPKKKETAVNKNNKK